ncbi:MAG: hypothetical protein R3C60_02180 [Parvularculaceae bacterium]
MKLVKLAGILASGLVAFTASATSASANVITIGGTAATITCMPDCQAIVGGSITDQNGPGLTGTPGSLSSMAANLYSFSPSNDVEEALALNALGGTNFSSGAQTNTGSANNFSFSSAATWVALKIGNLHFVVFNPTSGSISYSYAKNGAKAGGLSHYTEFGQVVPVPASIWLMVSALAGLGFSSSLGRRRDR